MERILSILAFVAAIGVGVYAYITTERQRGDIESLTQKVEGLTKTLGETQKMVNNQNQIVSQIVELIGGQAPQEPELKVDQAELTPEKNAAYLAEYEKQPGVIKTASGLMYRILKEGPVEGRKPTPASDVQIHYRGAFIDGTIFDTSYQGPEPTAEDAAPVLPLPRLIPGWIEALPMMKEGDVWELVLPSPLAYGETGQGQIPGGQTLVFRIFLVKVVS